MDREVFEFTSYKEFLRERAGPKDKRSGIRRKMAAAMGCQSAYLSQVLYKDAQLSLEQGEKLGKFFQFSGDESHFFLLLLQYERAGTDSLAEYFHRQISHEKQKRLDLKRRLNASKELPEDQKRIYYGGWEPKALHMASGIKKLQSVEALARHFGLSIARTREVVDCLLEMGLVQKNDDRICRSEKDLFQHKDSPWAVPDHVNWRLKAIQSLYSDFRSQDLHYTGVVTLGRDELEKIKAIFAQALKDSIAKVKDAPDEVAAAISFDVYQL